MNFKSIAFAYADGVVGTINDAFFILCPAFIIACKIWFPITRTH